MLVRCAGGAMNIEGPGRMASRKSPHSKFVASDAVHFPGHPGGTLRKLAICEDDTSSDLFPVGAEMFRSEQRSAENKRLPNCAPIERHEDLEAIGTKRAWAFLGGTGAQVLDGA
jgi:hypothetical protein